MRILVPLSWSVCAAAGFVAGKDSIPTSAPSDVAQTAVCPEPRDVERVRDAAHQLEMRAQEAERRFDLLWGEPPADPVPPEIAHPALEALAATIGAEALEIQCYDEVCVASYGFEDGVIMEKAAETEEALRDAGFRFAHVSGSSSPDMGSWVDIVLVDGPQTEAQRRRGGRLTGRMAYTRKPIP